MSGRMKRLFAPRAAQVGANVESETLLGVSSLVGDAIYDANGRFVGTLDEIVVDTRTGCVRHAVVCSGGFLGFGARRVAVPWSALTPDPAYRQCIVDAPYMRLTAVEVPKGDPWPRGASPA